MVQDLLYAGAFNEEIRMMTPTNVYWLTRLASLKVILVALACLCFVTTVFAGFAGEHCCTYGDDDYGKFVLKWARVAGVLSILLFVINVFTPNYRDVVAINDARLALNTEANSITCVHIVSNLLEHAISGYTNSPFSSVVVTNCID